MCGIAGILRVHPPGVGVADLPPPGEAIPERWLDILDESIKHRGPDGQGRFRDRARRADGCVVDVALVHRRLAIIDPACGHQPMVSERGKDGEGLVAVVFNGCIYNHRELRQELQAAGREFVTDHSDTEVLIHGWREWGAELGSYLDGMFAAAVWDRDSAALVLLRDWFGEKPLEYEAFEQRPKGWINVFASTYAGMAALGPLVDADGSHRPEQLERWLRFGFDLRPPFSGANSYSPGTTGVLLDLERWTDNPFGLLWNPPEPEPPGREQVVARDVERLLECSVDYRLEADVPVGCFLSGGVDSSLVAYFAKRRLENLETFTVRMPSGAYDESSWAERVAKLLGTKHRTLECAARPAEDLTKLITTLGLPFGDSSILPTHWVSRAARQHVAVALSGDGGDELFLGYERYLVASRIAGLQMLGLVPRWVLTASDPRSKRAKLARLREAARGEGYLDLVSIFPLKMLSDLLGRPADRSPWDEPPLLTREAMYWDLVHYLPHDLLRKTDAASMQCALEVRSPFLQPRLAAAAMGAHPDDLLRDGQRKGLLRQVARRYLPAEIVDRPKQGFAIPIGEWFRTDYGGMKQLLMDHLNSVEPWGLPSLGIELNMKFVRQMLDEHMSKKRDHSQRLYMLLVLSIWAKWLGSLSRRI
jgi:asparagine synthase (glutamine-hydrolysing)